MLLRVRDLHVALGGREVLRGVSLDAGAGEVVAVVGANGCGKTTLLRALLGRVGAAGEVRWDGRLLAGWPAGALARRVAYLPQTPRWADGQTAGEALRLGRVPHLGAFGVERPADAAAVRRVAGRLDLGGLLDRPMDRLSGGQRQRVLVGRALVQEPAAVLLDEPDTHLDLARQAELAGLLRALAGDGLLVVVASHDLHLAASAADRVGLIRRGTLAAGSPAEVLTAANLSDAFGVPVTVRHDPFHAAPAVAR